MLPVGVAPYSRNPDVRAAFREAIADVRGVLRFSIDAWALLRDHLHAASTLPENDAHAQERKTPWRYHPQSLLFGVDKAIA